MFSKMKFLLAFAFGMAGSASALPKMDSLLEVPNSRLFVYESQFNGQEGYEGPLQAYFLPELTVLDKMGDKVYFSYVPKASGGAEVSFRVILEANPSLTENTPALKTAMAQLYASTPENVKLAPLDVQQTHVEVHMDSAMGEIISAPADNFSLQGSLAFRLKLNRQGTQWLRDTVVRRGMEFGTIQGKVDFYDPATEANRTMDVSIPLFLDGLPSCVLSAVGC